MEWESVELNKPSYLKDVDTYGNVEFEITGTMFVEGKNSDIYIKVQTNWENFDQINNEESFITLKNDLPVSFLDLDYVNQEKIKKHISLKLKSSIRK